MTPETEVVAPELDPLPVLKGLAALRWLTGTYPSGHPMIGQKLTELDGLVREHPRRRPSGRRLV